MGKMKEFDLIRREKAEQEIKKFHFYSEWFMNRFEQLDTEEQQDIIFYAKYYNLKDLQAESKKIQNIRGFDSFWECLHIITDFKEDEKNDLKEFNRIIKEVL